MSTDFRALCAELLGALENEGHAHWPGGPDGDPLIEQARAVLARYGHQPAPPAEGEAIGPEWQPCVKLPITVHVREQRSGETHVSTREGITPVCPDDLIMRGVQGEEYPIGRELFNKTYRLGAAGHQPAPPVEGGVGELVAALRADAECAEVEHYDLCNMTAGQMHRAADLLEQRHPTPVPVTERLPGPEDCDEEGLCWWFSPADPPAGTFGVAACWVLRKHEPEDDFRTHWLPSTALPLPQGEVQP